MALQTSQLSKLSLGIGPVAGGLSLVDPFSIGDSEASLSENWQHRLGLLVFRSQLRDSGIYLTSTLPWDNASGTWNAQTLTWDTFSSGAPPQFPGPITRLDLTSFRLGVQYVVALTDSKIGIWDGNVNSGFIDITGSSISVGSPSTPWSSATGGAAATTPDVGFFACNGLNELIYWTGSPGVNAVKLISHASYTANAGNPASLVGRYVIAYAGRIFIAFTTEGGNLQPQRVRWCSDSDFFDWRPSARKGAGVLDCSDSNGSITGMWTLGQQLYVAKTDSIVVGRETGDIATPFVFPVSMNIGCTSGQSFQSIDSHTGIFLGDDNVYLVSGSEVEPVGDKIKGQGGINGLLNDLDYNNSRRIVSFIRPDLQEYYLCIPLRTSTTGEATRAYVYNYAEKLWWIENFPTKIHSGISVQLGSGASSWDNMIGTWNAQTKSWDDFTAGVTAPIQYVGTEYDSTVGATNRWRMHKLVNDNDPTDSSANPTSVAAQWESKLFPLNTTGGPGSAATVEGIWIYLRDDSGGTMGLTISNDQGQTSNSVKTFSTGTREVFFPVVLTGRLFKVKMVSVLRLSIRGLDVVYTLRRS